jgi:hypothetical protein
MDIESAVIEIVESAPSLKHVIAAYKYADPASNDMLTATKPIEIQVLPLKPLMRVGTVGDGNCLLHAILFSSSPTYRAHNKLSRTKISDEFRKILVAREEELLDLADAFYAEAGGAAALVESFEILKGKREEISLEMGPIIARLYGSNLLAIQVKEDISLKPATVTMTNYDPTLPTIVVNYIGGGLNFGNADFQSGGHYEVIIAGVVAAASSSSSSSSEKSVGAAAGGAGSKTSARRKTVKKKKAAPKTFTLNEVATKYIFQPEDPDLAHILDLFKEAP